MTFIASLVAFVIVALIALSIMSRYAGDPGLRGGKLQPCPATRNCVVSENFESKNIEPLDIRGMEPVTAWKILKDVVVATGGEIQEDNIQADNGRYLRATYQTPVFRFVDDFEARLDSENRVIHLRSASRVGHSDMGVNRKRIAEITAKFLSGTH